MHSTHPIQEYSHHGNKMSASIIWRSPLILKVNLDPHSHRYPYHNQEFHRIHKQSQPSIHESVDGTERNQKERQRGRVIFILF
jgi:hypothetical protein